MLSLSKQYRWRILVFITIQAHEYSKYPEVMRKIFRLRKKVFSDQLGWSVPVRGDIERDYYDELKPVYLVWCSEDARILYGMMRLMPTTGPTLLYDVFRKTFPAQISLSAPGVWEGTRMCIDEEAISSDFPEIDPGRAFSLLLLALCECALEHRIHTMVSNYEPHLKRIYRRTGVEVQELGRADGYGRLPVCCGVFEVSERVLAGMRVRLDVHMPLYRKTVPYEVLVPAVRNAA
jgi:acyl homoserine lactone synthase